MPAEIPAEVQAALDRLAEKVSTDTTVDGSAIALLVGLRETVHQLRDEIANGAVVDVQSIVARLDGLDAGFAANQQALADAVAANTEV